MQLSEVTFVDALAADTGFALDARSELERGFAEIWVAQCDAQAGTPDSFLLAWHAADELHVIAVGTRPNQRRKGLGRRLLETLIGHAKSTRSRLVLLEVRRSNRAALALYRSFGFSVSRLRHNYYEHPEEDGIEMQLMFDDNGDIVPTPDEVSWQEVSECQG